jgi:hypothetical protein
MNLSIFVLRAKNNIFLIISGLFVFKHGLDTLQKIQGKLSVDVLTVSTSITFAAIIFMDIISAPKRR